MKKFFALALLSLVSCVSPQVESRVKEPKESICSCSPGCSTGECCQQSGDTCSCQNCTVRPGLQSNP